MRKIKLQVYLYSSRLSFLFFLPSILEGGGEETEKSLGGVLEREKEADFATAKHWIGGFLPPPGWSLACSRNHYPQWHVTAGPRTTG